MRHPNAVALVATERRLEAFLELRRCGVKNIWFHLRNSYVNNTAENWHDMIEASRRGRVLLWGGNRFELDLWRHRLEMLDVTVAYGVLDPAAAAGRADVSEGTLPIRDQSALLDEDPATATVLVVALEHRGALAFMREHRLPRRMVVSIYLVKWALEREYILDPSAGFAIHTGGVDEATGLHVLRRPGTDRPLRVAVIGDSTAHIRHWVEPMWPELLPDVARERGRDIEVLGTATGLYIISQTLIRLARDILPLRPDVVVSCSTLGNDEVFASAESWFVHAGQLGHYRELARAHGHRLHSGAVPRSALTAAEHWLDTQRMMRGMCAELGVAYHALVEGGAPCHSQADRERAVHTWDIVWADDKRPSALGSGPDLSKLTPLIDAARQIDWLHDITGLLADTPDAWLDGGHTNAKGSRIIAERVFDIIIDAQGSDCE